jgi:hypothetical protein
VTRVRHADAELLVRGHPLTRDIAPSWIDTVLLAAVANYWWLSRTPEPPSLPGARAYQRAYADATISWVRRRVAG